MYSTKKFKQNSGQHNESNKLNDPQIHKLKFLGKTINFYIRSYSGDFDIFYEVFWKKTYSLENVGLKNINNIIDVGANVGYTSIFYNLYYPEAKILSIEPSNSNYVILKKNTSEIKNIMCEHSAIYTEDTIIDFKEYDFAYNSKIDVVEDSYPVKAQCLNTVLKKNNIQEVDLLKIDIEGAENLILSENNLWLKKVKNIIIEIHKPYTINALLKDIEIFGFEKNQNFKVIGELYLLSRKN